MKKHLNIALRIAMASCALASSALADNGTWINNGSANWSAAASWNGSVIADGDGNTADFTSVNITAARTVTLDSSRTIGKLRFGDMTTADFDWTVGVANNAVLTLSGNPVIEVTNRAVNINPVIAGLEGFTKTGGGALALGNSANTFTGNILLNAGQTRFKVSGALGLDPGSYVADKITLNGGILMNSDSASVLAANYGITLGSGGSLQAGWSKPLLIESPIVGAGGLTCVSDSTPGIITLSAANGYTGPTTVAGWLQINGSLDATSAVTVQSGGLLLGNGSITSPVTVNSGGNIGAGGLFATGTLTVNNAATLNGCTLHADLSTPAGLNDLLVVNGNLTLSGTVTVSAIALGGNLTPGTYRLINFTGTLTGSAANLVAAPSRYTITFDTSLAGQVDMIVQGGTPASLVWKGTGGVNWDINTTPNWLNGATMDVYRNGDDVLLDDSGSSMLPVTILSGSLLNTVVPGSVTVDTSKDYTLAGGRMAGPMTLTKKGTGLLALNAANTSLPHYFDGPIVIEGGMVRAGYARALGTTNGSTTIRSGATLDVNAQDLGLEPFVVEGHGVGGAGALVNYGAGQNNALRIVTMTGNTTVGGTGRFDIRNLEGIAFLNTGGQPYKLTKKGANQFSLVGVQVDPMLGEVDVQEGIFGFETTSTLGDPGATMTLGVNATLQLYNLNNNFYKPLVLKGGTAANIGNGAGASTINGPVTLLAQSVWNVGGTSVRVTSDITGAGGLTKTGSSPLYLDGVNTYAGPTIISAGSLILGSAASLSNSPSITLASGTTFNVSAVAAASVSGAFELNGANGQTLSGSGTVVGNVIAGTATTLLPGLSAGSLTNTGDLKLDGATAVFELGATNTIGGGVNDLIVVNGNLTLSGTINLRISALAPLDTVNPYTIVIYSGTPDFATATINILSDSRYTFTVDPTSAPGTLRVWAATVGAGAETLTWQGNVAGSETLWDIKTTANWSNSVAAPDSFYQGDRVKFDDTALGTAVNLTGTVTPATLTVSNETKNLTWTGSGKLSGPAGIVKQGAGKLTIANTGVNDNTGITTISAGTLEVGNGGTSGNLNSAAITNRGTLVFSRSDSITVANAIGGAGTLEKQGAGLMILSSVQPNLTGPVAVKAGTLRVGTATSLGTVADGTTVADGATLDVNALNLGNEVITVNGAGVGGQGAIVNSGGTQQNALHDVVLAGNTTFGGIGRWDIRTNSTGRATLGTGGNAYNLTKVGVNQSQLVDVTVDSALADIDVKAGILGYEATTGGLGDPNRTLTVRSNATFQFWNSSVPLNKRITLEGRSTIIASSGTANTTLGPITLSDGMANLYSASGIIIYHKGQISGPGGIIKGDAGSVHLVGANSFAGNVIHNYGNLVLSNSLAVGNNKTLAVNYNTAVSGGAGVRLYLRGGITTPTDVTSVFTSTTAGGDYRTSITSDSLTNTWGGPMIVQGSGIISVYADFTTNLFAISGPITGAPGFTGTFFIRSSGYGLISGPVNLGPGGNFSKTDAGTWIVSSQSNTWKQTQIAVGMVRLGTNDALCISAPLLMGQADANAAALDLNGYSQRLASFIPIVGTGTRRIGNESTTADSTFIYDGGTNLSTFAGVFVNGLSAGTRKVALEVASGTLQLGGANTHSGATTITGGTLALISAGTIAATPIIDVRAGATLDVTGKGTTYSLAAGQTLKGNGTVNGTVTAASGATIAAGGSIGTLNFTEALTFSAGSTNVAEADKSATPTCDLINAVNIIYGGTLVVQNLGPALAAGDSLKLFNAMTYTGDFAAIVPEIPGTGLAWDKSELATSGILKVKANFAPEVGGITPLADGNFRLTINGELGQSYSVRISTDVALPLTDWTILTNGTIPSVPFLFDDLTATNYPERFYILSTP